MGELLGKYAFKTRLFQFPYHVVIRSTEWTNLGLRSVDGNVSLRGCYLVSVEIGSFSVCSPVPSPTQPAWPVRSLSSLH